jgi:hypothetical protein
MSPKDIPMQAQRGGVSIPPNHSHPVPEGGEWSAELPGCLTPGKDPVPPVQEVGSTSQVGVNGTKNLNPPGYDHRTFHPAASRYTDCAISAVTLMQNEESRRNEVLCSFRTSSL